MIKAENLSYVYQPGLPQQHSALKNISFEIADHDFVAVIGHTGSGKSTLIQHLNALIKPTSGRILLDGEDITDPKADLRAVRRRVGIVFQYPEHQLFEETVYRDIAFGPSNMGLSEEEIQKRVKEAMSFVGLDESFCEKSPFELSGGQKRRVAIAGVLSMRPDVLILDEPTAGLDPKGRDEILSQLAELHKNSSMTVIFVSHSMEDVAKTAKSVMVLNRGELFMYGGVAEVFSHAAELQKIGLNVPQITLLTHRLIDMGFDLPRDIYTVKYAADIFEGLMSNKGNG